MGFIGDDMAKEPAKKPSFMKRLYTGTVKNIKAERARNQQLRKVENESYHKQSLVEAKRAGARKAKLRYKPTKINQQSTGFNTGFGTGLSQTTWSIPKQDTSMFPKPQKQSKSMFPRF